MESIQARITKLMGMSLAELKVQYIQVFGEEFRGRHRDHCWKKIAYELQRQHEGRPQGSPTRAKNRLEELMDDRRIRLPSTRKTLDVQRLEPQADARLPPAGSMLTRNYKGACHEVQVLVNGFAYQGEHYKTLTAVAKAITGKQWNGFVFFGLPSKPRNKTGAMGAGH